MAFRDPDARRAYDAEWRRKRRVTNPEAENAPRRARYAADPRPTLERNAQYRTTRRQELAENERRRRRDYTPEQKMAIRLRRYGLSVERYAEMLAYQGGACAICRRIENPLSVDHCHGTGRVRGLLCKNCNKGIGMFGESMETIRVALSYMEQFAASAADDHAASHPVTLNVAKK